MTSPGLFTLVSGFFVPHLSAERNVSPHTAAAYRDALKLLLQFAASTRGGMVDQLCIEDLTADVVLGFLTHLEVTRHNTVRTRNARLAAIHSFFRYVLAREPALAESCQRVLSIPMKKTLRPVLGYFQEAELAHLLAQVDRTTPDGERDYLLVGLLYDTGARIQELLDVTPRDCRLDAPPFVRLRGKGRRERLCPLLPQTARLITRFLAAESRSLDDHEPLLHRKHGERLTRHGARYVLAKYLDRARSSMPSLDRPGLSLHTLRHTKAMHLLQSGVPLITIKDFLGHADLKTTEVYVQIDLEMKRHALEAAGSPSHARRGRPRLAPRLIAWLESL
jgi:site-specific recombinase XerD